MSVNGFDFDGTVHRYNYNSLDNIPPNIAPAYSASATYAVGDYCTKDNVLYKCSTAISTAEAWNSAHWTQVQLATDVADIKDDLNDIKEEISSEITVSGNMVHLKDVPSGQQAEKIEITVMPIQDGTGVPSASNVRTISGRSSVTIIQLKKNILTFFVDGYVPSVSTGKLVQAGGARSDYIPANELTKYTLTLNTISGANSSVYAFFYDKDKTYLSNAYQTGTGESNTLTFSTPAKTAFIMCRLGANSNISYYVNGQMEFGDEATTYEAYNATQHTISLSNYAPIYGATIDATNGILTITHGYIASYAGESIGSPWISSKDVYAEGTSPSTGAQVVYPLSTPVEHNITPQLITFSDGINNIYSDSGEISINIDSPKEGSIAEKVATLEKDKIDKQQGIANVGKVLTVGSDGVVKPSNVPSTGLSEAAKIALLNCFDNVAWANNQGQNCYNALLEALNNQPISEYPKITASFVPGVRTVYTKDAIDTLKLNLSVTYYEDENDSGTVLTDSDYTLSGTLTVGNSIITASYNGLTTSFSVTAKAPKYSYQLSSGELTLQTGLPAQSSSSGQMVPWIDSSYTVRKTLSCAEGSRLFGSPTAGQFIDGAYLIPVPGDATSASVTITPSTMYTALNVYRLEKNSSGTIVAKYVPTEVGWTAGTSSGTWTQSADQLRVFMINIKYDSAGSSFPSNPTDFTIQFS